jgi:hypothetical protein
VLGGAITYRIGTSAGAADIKTGSVAVGAARTVTFAPATNGTVYVEFENANADTRQVDNVGLDSPVYEIDHP